MAKRRLLLHSLLIIILILACTISRPVKIHQVPSKRTMIGFRQGLWIRAASTASPEAIPNIVRAVERMKITDIFVQVVVGGYAYYDSNILPRSQYLSRISGPAYDPLDSLLKIYAETPVRVHAWVNTLLCWSLEEPPESLNHVFYIHPEWFMKDVNRKSMIDYSYTEWKNMGLEGMYLDPENPDVTDFVQSICTEIVTRYPVDGIHLDFIRYPGVIWGLPENDEAALLAGTDVSSISWCNLLHYARLNFLQRWAVWHFWRMTQHRPWVIARMIDGVIRSTAQNTMMKDCQVSAAVFANPGLARFSFGQHWTEWHKDEFLPVVMSYTPDAKVFTEYMDFAMIYRRDALMGIGLMWPDMQAPARWQAEYVRNKGGAGVCYFDFAAVDTMLDQLSPTSNNTECADPEVDRILHAAVREAFADIPDSGLVEKGKHFCAWGTDLDFAAFLLSLSLNPGRDLTRMDLSRQDFIELISQDVAAFEYLDQKIFPLGEDLIEPPKRLIRYTYIPWSDGDSLTVLENAKGILAYDKKAILYPKAGDPLTRAVFNVQVRSNELLITPAGVYAFVVDSILPAGRRHKRQELPPGSIPVYANWTINARATEITKGTGSQEKHQESLN
jgi:uncharacterized lipoprotein YddW (UPF0748 family)